MKASEEVLNKIGSGLLADLLLERVRVVHNFAIILHGSGPMADAWFSGCYMHDRRKRVERCLHIVTRLSVSDDARAKQAVVDLPER